MEQETSPTREEILTQVLAQELLNREQNLSQPASAFSSVSGVLGGFSIAILVLCLNPQIIIINSNKDWIASLILISATFYIYSSGIFANSTSFKEKETKRKVFNFGLVIFHSSNYILSSGILLLTFQFELFILRIVAIFITISSFLVMIINIGAVSKRGLREIIKIALMSFSSGS
ncbi:MAG: hypothetical protein F6K54_02575 [Okeania sp. SIO3B5]|uniref:hypothetical protein n=1 Tax=Okeania sp. SIO3B5 TaxID=2607811 RepID=UPI0013FFDCD8|nr:hypothetical protein [Okeania sp. SIO3B5]NEO52062.1 hypothetical protein [Okeania sp. SIO3B5]